MVACMRVRRELSDRLRRLGPLRPPPAPALEHLPYHGDGPAPAFPDSPTEAQATGQGAGAFPHDSNGDHHANGVELQHVVTGIVSTVTFGIVEIILSRLSAKVAEKPSVALPV